MGFYSCNKKDSTAESVEIYPGYQVTFPDTIIAASFPNSPEVYAFDVDNDSINDYEIICVQEHVVAVYTYNETQISSLDKNAFLVTDSMNDTTFVNVQSDTTVSHGKKDIVVKKKFSHKRISKNDSIAEVKELHYVVPFKENRLLGYRNCTAGMYTLTRDDYAIDYFTYEKGPDWQLRVDAYYSFPKLFPDNQVSYIGIKKIIKGKEKTGWIKLMLLNQQIISVLEVAIQK